MVAHFTMRAYGVNQVVRFVKDIWLHRKNRQTDFFYGKDILLHTCAKCSEIPSYIRTMASLALLMIVHEKFDLDNIYFASVVEPHL